MRSDYLGLLTLASASALSASLPPPPPPPPVDSGPLLKNEDLRKIEALTRSAREESEKLLRDHVGIKLNGPSCTLKNLRVRREWDAISKKEKKNYIDAVKCLQSKPALTPESVASGAKSRFDDFVATHINQTLIIHYTGNFLSWHRYFTWLYEEALRNECGYTGTQPYWNWAKTAITGLKNSPVFDGSEFSMSGDGEHIPDQKDIVIGASSGLPLIYLPTGNGGGCVTSGPFKDMHVNLGPASLDKPGGEVEQRPNPLSYNSRCLSRDLGDIVNQRYANASAVISNLIQPKNVFDFQMQMQGVPGEGSIGIHGGGHYAIGGDPARDVFTSPGDPVFYLHHSMIDRVWWMWQMMDPKKRIHNDEALMGTNTFLNNPPSPNTTFDDFVHYGFAGPSARIGDLMSTFSGPFCYIYI